MEACESIIKGHQVFGNYGQKCNSIFFLNYGFINLNNDSNEVPITVFLNESDPLHDLKLKLINEK